MKMWSLGTALRNPNRIPSFFNVLQNFIKFNGGNWNEVDELDYYIELIRSGVVSPKNVSAIELNQSQEKARRIMLMRYETAPMRGRVLGSLFYKLGLVRITNRIELTNLGISFLNITNNEDFQYCLIEALEQWRISNGISQINRKVQSIDFNPFLATIKVIREVNRLEGRNTGIYFWEYIYFVKTLDSNDLILSIANTIVRSRRDKNILINWINYVKENCTNKYSDSDYADNEIRYFINTGVMNFNKSNGLLTLV